MEKTASWLCEIGLDEKYATICRKEDINGRALLLLACKYPDQLRSVFQLKTGPETILMQDLEPHLCAFEPNKHQAPGKPQTTKMMGNWNVKQLCSWLDELGTPTECLVKVEEEEIGGRAFLLLRSKDSDKLKTSLQLKLGPWIVLQHELLLYEEEPNSSESSARKDISTHKDSLSAPIKRTDGSKEPLAAGDPSTEGINTGPPPKSGLSREEEKLLLLKNAVKLDISASDGPQDRNECFVRSIFFQRGQGANALEKLFNFIVITKDALTGDGPRKLWAKIREKTSVWIKLLPEEDLKLFQSCEKSELFFYGPNQEKVCLRDGKVCQIVPAKLLDDEYRKSCFVVLIDEQILDDKKMWSFSFDKKGRQTCDIKVKLQSKYHASFDVNKLDLKWSKYLRSLMNLGKAVLSLNQSEEKPSRGPDLSRFQTPRPFDGEFGTKNYSEGFILNCWETGSKDMIAPVHEFKLFRVDSDSSRDEAIRKFVYETLRFACGCLNERTNGTIHFGVADEVEKQTCGYKPKEIVGVVATNKPFFNDKLTEFIDKCFVGESRSNVHNCIRPPVFVPVKGLCAGQQSSDKVVIEVDIEPSYSLCKGDIFKVGFKSLKALDFGKTEHYEARAYIRHGSETKAIIDVAEMEDYMKNLPKLDEQRKKREQVNNLSMESQIPVRNLFTKLKRLLCANKKVLDSSVYPILVLSKPDASMNQEMLDERFSFIQNIKWFTVFDFDDEGSASRGLCKVFKAGPDTPQFDIHEAADYEKDHDAIENAHYKTHWIFGNGYSNLGQEPLGFKQWNNSKRKRGLSQVIQSVEERIPVARAVVLFLLLSKEYQPMADIFKEFCTYLDGPNQLIYVAENSEIVSGWEKTLSTTCLEEHELRERGIVGMSWTEFRECIQQLVDGTDRDQRYVTMATGSPYPLGHVSFNGIEIVSAKECDEIANLSPEERLELSSKVETDFYRGYPVTWTNFWFTDAQKNHVLRRDNYADLKNLIEKACSGRAEGKVQTITIYHHIGAGASTMTRQALWDFRRNPHFPYRCAVVTKIDGSTCKELLQLRRIGYGEENEAQSPPVLALVEDTDDFVFREFRSQVVEHASKLPRTNLPVCVFLYCKPTQKPLDCHRKESATSIFLEQHLSQKEVEWFKDKYKDMKRESRNKGAEYDFENYANENLISFMIMKENYNRKYASSIVERNLNLVSEDEETLLKYISLLNLYNPNPVFASCFDTLMVSFSLLQKRIFRDWVEDLTHSARIFLREVDCSTHSGSGKAIAIVHPIIASELLDQIAKKNASSVSKITLDFLESSLLESQPTRFTSKSLFDGANRMLKNRKKFENGDDEQTKFSPLIEKILYVKDADDGEKKATEQSIHEAAEVLRKGLDKFQDSMLAQQMARVFYLNAGAFSESRIDECFDHALTFCKKAIEMNPNNSFLFDTMGRIHEAKMKILCGPVRKDNLVIEISAVTPVLPLAFEAMKWFKKSQAASVDYQNMCGFRGELSVIFYLLDVLRCTGLFRGEEGLKKIQGYLAYGQVIPSDVDEPWREFHEAIRDLKNRFSNCMESLAEEFTIYKENSAEAILLPRQIAWFKAQYHTYFGEGDLKWNLDIPEERWQYRWQKVNQYLAGDVFSSVFKIDRVLFDEEKPEETLQVLKNLAHENVCETIHPDRYKDLLLYITSSMALHSPYGSRSNEKSDFAKLIQEYKEIYKSVDQLLSLEIAYEGYKRLYAHLLKVMFLWPRKDLKLNDCRVQDFYEALRKLQKRWESKRKRCIDTDKMLKQNVYKYMPFKEATRQYTTLFYLGKGTGLDVFVHINELPQSRGSIDWRDRRTTRRLERLTGVVEARNIIRMKNPLDQSRMIDVYYSSFREGGFSKEEVSFFLGFSWQGPIALDIKYTNSDHVKHSAETSDAVLDDQFQLNLPKYVVTYEEYTSRMRKLMKKLDEINSLKRIKNKGGKLDENQVTTHMKATVLLVSPYLELC